MQVAKYSTMSKAQLMNINSVGLTLPRKGQSDTKPTVGQFRAIVERLVSSVFLAIVGTLMREVTDWLFR